MAWNEVTLTEISKLLELQPEEYRALRVAAQHDAFGAEVLRPGRAQVWTFAAVYRATLFLVLHRRLGFSAPAAAKMVAKTSGIGEAILALKRGDRWRFEIQYLAQDMAPVCDYAPWEAARSGLPTTALPLARTVIDLREAWGFIPQLEADAKARETDSR